jgi:hypothetical protein
MNVYDVVGWMLEEKNQFEGRSVLAAGFVWRKSHFVW